MFVFVLLFWGHYKKQGGRCWKTEGGLLLWQKRPEGLTRGRQAGSDKQPHLFHVQAWLSMSLRTQVSLNSGEMGIALTIHGVCWGHSDILGALPSGFPKESHHI